jgi:protein ImuB
VSFEYAENDLDRLLATLTDLLVPLLAELSARHEALASLRLALTLDDRSERHEEISTATPTLEAKQILFLIRLRLESLSLSSGVVELELHALGAKTSQHQLGLFMDASPQHLEAAERGLALVRAQLGDGAVVCARLANGHLPEACFAWEPLRRLAAPKPMNVASHPLVRRMYTTPIPLPSRDRHEPDGWLVAGVADGPVEEVIGPHAVSGGWWAREVSRAYYFVRTRNGRLLWIYHDQKRRRWFLHGEVQ